MLEGSQYGDNLRKTMAESYGAIGAGAARAAVASTSFATITTTHFDGFCLESVFEGLRFEVCVYVCMCVWYVCVVCMVCAFVCLLYSSRVVD